MFKVKLFNTRKLDVKVLCLCVRLLITLYIMTLIYVIFVSYLLHLGCYIHVLYTFLPPATVFEFLCVIFNITARYLYGIFIYL